MRILYYGYIKFENEEVSWVLVFWVIIKEKKLVFFLIFISYFCMVLKKIRYINFLLW